VRPVGPSQSVARAYCGKHRPGGPVSNHSRSHSSISRCSVVIRAAHAGQYGPDARQFVWPRPRPRSQRHNCGNRSSPGGTQPGSSSANRRRQDWQRWTWDLRQSAPRSIHESHTPASPRHVTECNVRRVRSHVRLWPILGARCGRRWPPRTVRTRVSCENHRNQAPAPGAASRGFAARAPVTPCHPAYRCGRSGVTRVRRARAPASSARQRRIGRSLTGACSLAMRCVITPTATRR
jgi:hypothetical protein